MRPLASLVLLLLIAVLAAGCRSSPPAEAGPVATARVEMPPSYRFEPVAITVPAHTTVTWHNGDNFTHTVQLPDGTVHTVRPGEDAAIAFDTPGDYPYVCTLHPQNMRGTVTVTGR
jgi:plastocyanin